MGHYALAAGDLVFSATDLFNDGTIPDLAADALVAAAGARGVVIKTGSLEHRPEIAVYLVRFENAQGELGAAVGCFAEELTQEPANR